MTDIHSERLTKQNVHQNLSQTSKIDVLNFGTRIISHSILLSRLYVHWGHFGLEDSTLIVVAPSSPSLSLASQTLSGVWLPSLGPFHEIEGGRSTAAAHAQNLVRSEHIRWPRSTFPFSVSRSPFTFICASFFGFSVSRSPFALICASRFPFSASRFAFSVSRSPFALICASRFPFFYFIIILRNALTCERSFGLSRNDGPRCRRLRETQRLYPQNFVLPRSV